MTTTKRCDLCEEQAAVFCVLLTDSQQGVLDSVHVCQLCLPGLDLSPGAGPFKPFEED